MSDAQGALTPPTEEEKRGLGRNQLIGIGMTALPIALGFALVCMGKLPSDQWVTMAQGTAAVGTGATLGVSGIIKAIEAWRK